MLNKYEDGLPTDGLTSFQTRRSMHLRRSSEATRLSSGSFSFPPRPADQQRLMHSYESEGVRGTFGLSDLAEDSEDDDDTNGKRTSFDGPTSNGVKPNGKAAVASPIFDRT